MIYKKCFLTLFIIIFISITNINAENKEKSVNAFSDINGNIISKFPINYNTVTSLPLLPQIESYILIDPEYVGTYGESEYVLGNITYSAVFKYASEAKDYLKKRSNDTLAYDYVKNKVLSPDKVDANKIMTRMDFVPGIHYAGIGSAHFLGMSNVLYHGLGSSADDVIFKPAVGKAWSMQVGNSSVYTITNWGMENITIDGQLSSASLLVINSSPARPTQIKTLKPLAYNIVLNNIKFTNCNGIALDIRFAENISLNNIIIDSSCTNVGKNLFYMVGFHNAVINNFEIKGSGDFTVGGYEYDFTSDKLSANGLSVEDGNIRISGSNSSMFSNGTVYLYVPESDTADIYFTDYPVSVICRRTVYEFPNDNGEYLPDIYMFKTLEQARAFTDAPYFSGIIQAVVKKDIDGAYSYFIFDDDEWGDGLLSTTIDLNFEIGRRWSLNIEKPNVYLLPALNAEVKNSMKIISKDYGTV